MTRIHPAVGSSLIPCLISSSLNPYHKEDLASGPLWWEAETNMAKVVKVMNHTRLWNPVLSWYSPSATCWIYIHGLEYSLGNHSFSTTWSCLIVDVLASPEKFPEPSSYWTMINCAFTFRSTNVFFGCFCGDVIAQFELMKLKFPN